MSSEYNDLLAKYPLGKMDPEDFKRIFNLAFPERPEEKVNALTEKLRNCEKTDGSIRKLQYPPLDHHYHIIIISHARHSYVAILVQ